MSSFPLLPQSAREDRSHRLGHGMPAPRSPLRLLTCALFVVVALLLVADLHSSYAAGSAKWETNPFLTLLAESVGPRAALVAIKAVDFICLGGMYALWRRSRAHLVFTLALSAIGLIYIEIVLNNYLV